MSKKSNKNISKNKQKEDENLKISIEYKKGNDFSKWYQQVLLKTGMLEYYDVSGCYILPPWSFSIWKIVSRFIDEIITEMGVEPAYFPMFVSGAALEKEKDHLEGFSPEVAWVTRAGSTKLEEPVAIRPTSETIMYPCFSKWIRSHRDLPLRLNQWNNVVRWEFKHPQPFIRTREFLWQEGHSAFLTREEAEKEVYEILDLYQRVYEELLAVPVIKGKKSEKEKFCGGLFTTTCEAYIPATGRGIQGATSHCLGQNFSKMFNIKVENPDIAADNNMSEEAKKLCVWQNSWGLSTRVIGVMVMVHGDDKGLVLPPKVATLQVIIIPCGLKASSTDEQRELVERKIEEIADLLKKAKIRVKHDLRSNYTPGYKFNYWEQKGVPLRLEIGPKDVVNDSVMCVRRDTGEKAVQPVASILEVVNNLLNTIQSDMFKKAKCDLDNGIKLINKWDEFVPSLDSKCLVLAPWCEREACEEDIKDQSKRKHTISEPEDEKAPSMGAKSLCIPFEQPQGGLNTNEQTKCIKCSEKAKSYTLFGRSY